MQMNAEKSNKSGPGPGKILGRLPGYPCLAGHRGLVACDLSIKNQTQAILNLGAGSAARLVDKTLDNIRAWRKRDSRTGAPYQLLRKCSGFCGNRCQALLARRAGIIFRPRFPHSDDDEIRTMAEQLVYMQDPLKRIFTRRRAWSDAGIPAA